MKFGMKLYAVQSQRYVPLATKYAVCLPSKLVFYSVNCSHLFCDPVSMH